MRKEANILLYMLIIISGYCQCDDKQARDAGIATGATTLGATIIAGAGANYYNMMRAANLENVGNINRVIDEAFQVSEAPISAAPATETAEITEATATAVAEQQGWIGISHAQVNFHATDEELARLVKAFEQPAEEGAEGASVDLPIAGTSMAGPGSAAGAGAGAVAAAGGATKTMNAAELSARVMELTKQTVAESGINFTPETIMQISIGAAREAGVPSAGNAVYHSVIKTISDAAEQAGVAEEAVMAQSARGVAQAAAQAIANAAKETPKVLEALQAGRGLAEVTQIANPAAAEVAETAAAEILQNAVNTIVAAVGTEGISFAGTAAATAAEAAASAAAATAAEAAATAATTAYAVALAAAPIAVVIMGAAATMQWWLPKILERSGMVNNTLYGAKTYIDFQGAVGSSCSRANLDLCPYTRKDLNVPPWSVVGGDRGHACIPERYSANVYLVSGGTVMALHSSIKDRHKRMKVFGIGLPKDKSKNNNLQFRWSNG